MLKAVLGVSTVVFLACGITFSVLYFTDDASADPEMPAEPSKAQVNAGSRILNAMDESADPCEDFWQYSCGGWLKQNTLPSSKGRLTTFDQADDVLTTVLKAELEKSTGKGSIKKAQDYYASCMDTETVEASGSADMIAYVNDVLGGWPIGGDAFTDNASYDDFIKDSIVKFATNAGGLPLVGIYTSVDEEAVESHIIAMDQPGLLLLTEQNYESKQSGTEKQKEAYINFLTDYAKLYCDETNANDNCKRETIRNTAEDVYALENNIANIVVERTTRAADSSLTFNKKTVAQFALDHGHWGEVIVSAMKEIYSQNGQEVTDLTIMNDSSEDYFDLLQSVIALGDQSVIQSWMVFRALANSIDVMPAEYMASQNILNEVLYGTTSRDDRYISCIAATNNALAFPVGSLYVKEAFDEDSKIVMDDMIEMIRVIFETEILDDADWMDEPTKSQARIKAEAVVQFIGYPDYIVDPAQTKMDADYASLTVSDSAFNNLVNSGVMKYKEDIEILSAPTERDRWSTGPAIVNAWYSPTRNSITFPAGILQPPFYDSGASKASNYGGIGTVIGHELTHGFDDQGSQYGADGNKNNWWSEESAAGFAVNGKCMSDQYSAFYWDQADMNVNGEATLGENIADNGGIRESFFAYREWSKTNEDVKPPGTNHLSYEQQFFLGFSQVWCAKYTDAEAANRVKTDVHSPNPFRVEGPLGNFVEFAKAFECTKGQKYYPDDTCQVW